ncbi:alpha-1,2-fucosyltransferase [Lyngbya sp. CCY1209]|uniref:alpha-1,2-fucosyltransferase n=1 Tax=Lyngbya sp. CCY1209 TaxID=2886103 RepID=UPI002D1FE728|nr:alpha-1,2-fucosyltransferase [Lyngbya sp. CCY1209]MEB3887458.1 alpha-1,2-fucosyltransferase [Lyngbya sp. CCY1209]
MVTNSQIGKYGLGEQLFQYAVLKRIALQRHYRLRLNVSHKNFLLSEFKIGNYEIITPEEAEKITNLYQEKHFHFDPGVLAVPFDTDLRGHFQSEKYFRPIADIIRKELTCQNQAITETVNHFTNRLRIDGSELISIYVKRGNLLLDKSLEIDTSPGCNYYRKAMDYFQKNGDRPIFVICSDDLEWCRQNFQHPNVVYSPFATELENLELMRSCDRNIIANNALSWWGAWLNDSPQKQAIAPKQWFGLGLRRLGIPLSLKLPDSTQDLIPKSWITI